MTDAASGITVTVDVPEGALPADAELQVTLLGGAAATPETAQTPGSVAGELDGAGIEYDDFVSLDLTFYDAAGQEVEPLKPVQVRFTMPAALLPDDVDPATLAVQHLAEDENGEVETVETLADAADTADGTVTLDGDVTAAFETDGFSVYALTFSAKPAPRADGDESKFTFTFHWDWMGNRGDVSDKTVTIDFKIVDTEGNPIRDEDGQPLTYELEYTFDANIYLVSDGSRVINFFDDSILELLNGKDLAVDVEEGVIVDTDLKENVDKRPGSKVEEDGNTYNEITVGEERYRFKRAIYTDDLNRRHPFEDITFYQYPNFLGVKVQDGILGEYDAPDNAGLEAVHDKLMDYRQSAYCELGYTTVDGDIDPDSYTFELVYQKQPEPTLDEIYEKPEIAKKAVLRDDNTYDLSLQVAGREIIPPVSNKIDVLFVVDGSTSMERTFGEDAAGNSISRQDALETAVQDLVDKLENPEKVWGEIENLPPDPLDIRYAAVQFGFGGYSVITPDDKFDDARVLQQWTSDASALTTAIENSADSLEGGTNTQAGLITAKAALQEVRPDARRYVIFVSDGGPANYYVSNGDTSGTGSAATDPYAQTQALIAAEMFPWVNGFYTVYINESDDTSPLQNMKDLLEKISSPRAASGMVETRVGGPYLASNSTELTKTFDKLVEEMTVQMFSDVEVSDILSNWVEPVADDDGNITPKLTIYQAQRDQETGELVCDEKTGEWLLTEIEENKADPDDVYKEVSVDYDTTERKITLKTEETRQDTTGTTGSYYDPAHLRGDYVYEVTLNVKLTEDRDNRKTAEGFFTVEGRYPEMDNPYAENDGFADGPETKGDPGTGTHAGQPGFYSNKVATLDYSVFSDPQEQMEFPKPVVQLPYVELTITKTVEGAMGSYGDDFDFTLTLTKKLTDDHGDPIIEHWDEPLKIVKEDPTAGITGTTAEDHKKQDQLNVIGGQPSDPGAGGGTADDPNAYTYGFTLSHDEQIVLVVPAGYEATVTEEDVNSRGYKVSGCFHWLIEGTWTSSGPYKDGNILTYKIGNLDTIFDFRNTREAVAPTGLEGDHTAPYVLMVSASALAGMALLAGMAARRARRRREW